MSNLKLFSINRQIATEVPRTSVALEKSLQTLIEKNLEALLGIRFLATEFSTGRDHGGRMDTLGIDENGCPAIIEYKRSSYMNVINQGLFYLDWLVTHRGDFEILVLRSLGAEAMESVDWSAPRLICIAGGFSKYDEHAIKQMNRNIELIRYVRFENDLLLLEQVNAASAPPENPVTTATKPNEGPKNKYTTVSQYLERADSEMQDLYEAIKETLQGMGDDVQFKALRFYFAFKRIKNFACVEIKNQNRKILVYIKVDPDSIEDPYGITRDVRDIGHFGTGDLEITISDMNDLNRARPWLERSYENA